MSSYPNSGRPYDLEYRSGAGSATLIRFFNAVYSWMAAGLALTALVAWWVSTQPELMARIFSPPVPIVLFIVEIGLVITIAAAVNKINATMATVLFMLFAAVNGLTFSIIFLVYTQASITSTFLVTAGMFGAMSVYGMVTKTDLTRLGNILVMGLLGLIIATIVNMFWANSTLYWIITYAGVLIFTGLIAYDTQRLRSIAIATEGNAALASRLAVSGALILYLDFINLFLHLLRALGDRR